MLESQQTRDQSKHNLAVEILRKTGSLRLTAFGNSMLPALFPGDILTIEAASLAEIQTGDVVLFARRGRFFIHRNLRPLQRGSETLLLTRGDAMPHPDEPVTANELLGRVVTFERGPRPATVPRCSLLRRFAGLLLAYSSRLRSLALRWHARKLQAGTTPAEFLAGDYRGKKPASSSRKRANNLGVT
jgi:signal peptidase